MDAFELLKADHEKVAGLFQQLEAASGKAKLSVFNQIRTELELHTHIEEKIFYPALEKPEETHDLTLEAYEEHDVVKKLLKELGSSKTANEEWEAKAKVLQENVEHHVEEEEGELFPKAEGALTPEQLDTLGERMEAEKARRQGGPAARASAGNSSKKGSKKGGKKSSKKASKKAGKKAGAAKKGSTKKSASKGGTRKGGAKKASKSSYKSSGSKKGGKKSGTKKSSKKGRR